MVIELKLFQMKEMVNIFKISRDEVIHCDDMKSLFNKTIT